MFFMLPRAHHHIILHARLVQDLRQAGIVPERIHIIAYFSRMSQMGLQEPLPQQAVPGKGFAGWQIAIRLHPPSAHGHPAPFGHPLLDAPKKFRFIFHDPFIIADRSSRKDKARRLFHAFQSAQKGGFDLRRALRPSPQPHRIQMRVTDKMKLLHCCLLV